MALDFRGAATRLEDIDLPRIGYEIGVGEDVIHAIIDVEAPKSGFDDQGRPRILFEPHVFYRNLKDSPKKLQAAISAGLAYKDWKKGAYGKESEQYPKLLRAIEIDETAALKACSWGRSQILGENHLLAGYATPQAMVADFCDDEDNHIEAMVQFLKSKKLDPYLRTIDKLNRASTPDDWRPVAKGYNGTGYEANDYHSQLAKRHNWWRGKPDTPWSPAESPAAALPEPVSLPPATPLPEPALEPPHAAPRQPPKASADNAPAEGWFITFLRGLIGKN